MKIISIGKVHIMIDLHVHTHHSCDSRVTMEEYCQEALKRDVKILCFTEHLDCNPVDDGHQYYDAGKFFDEFKRVREKYSDRLTVLCGLEFSEPHVYQKEFEQYSALGYDFILGSIHYWMADMFLSQLVKTDIPVGEVFERYWEEVYKAVSCGGFDAIAHLDFPKRYYQQCFWSESQLEDIFKQMVKNNIALEINTSSLRKGLTEVMPGRDMIELYRKAGGVKMTIGADTHRAEDLAADYDSAVEQINEPLKNVVYIQRKPVFITE